MTTPTPPLSPAAQAIRDAYKSGGLDAALIAAADQVVPETEQPELHGSRTCSTAWQRWDERSAIRSQLLTLAAKLRQEGQA